MKVNASAEAEVDNGATATCKIQHLLLYVKNTLSIGQEPVILQTILNIQYTRLNVKLDKLT